MCVKAFEKKRVVQRDKPTNEYTKFNFDSKEKALLHWRNECPNIKMECETCELKFPRFIFKQHNCIDELKKALKKRDGVIEKLDKVVKRIANEADFIELE